MQKIYSKILKGGALLLFIGSIWTTLVTQFSGYHDSEGVQNVKKSLPWSAYHQDVINSLEQNEPGISKMLKKAIRESIPGKLVCLRKKPRPGDLSDIPHFNDEPENAIDQRLIQLKSLRPPPISQLSPNRPLGCCPPGNPFGDVYRVGSACCVDKIFDVSTHFCCTSNFRLLEFTPENLEYCHPVDGKQFCRIEDLDMRAKNGMSHNCQFDSRNRPTNCEFACPVGSRIIDEPISAACGKNGVFEKVPECCRGCKQEFKLDLWFLIQPRRNITQEQSVLLQEFLKNFLNFILIGKDNVHIGFRIAGNDETERSNLRTNQWEARKAIDELDFAGTNSDFGDTMEKLADSGYSESSGARRRVDNMVITIILDPLTSSVLEGAKKLKQISEVITIGVGHELNPENLQAIASSLHNAHRVTNIDNLDALNPVLHEHICGTDCI